MRVFTITWFLLIHSSLGVGVTFSYHVGLRLFESRQTFQKRKRIHLPFSVTMSLQTIEDFEKEVVNSSVYQEDMRLAALRSSSSLHQENPTVVIGELATGQESLTWPAFSSQPPRKQRRREVSLRELQTEQEALAQMGSTNWIGRLFGTVRLWHLIILLYRNRLTQ